MGKFEINCFCCEKYLGETNMEIHMFFCDDCAILLKERFGNRTSMENIMKLKEEICNKPKDN